MSAPISFSTLAQEASSGLNQPGHLFYKGEKVRYRGEEAVIVSVNPLLVIKSRSRVVCGDLYNCLNLRKEKTPFDENLR